MSNEKVIVDEIRAALERDDRIRNPREVAGRTTRSAAPRCGR
jgi:hypothetical protein